MSLVLQRPYEFIPPHRGSLWPTFIQKFRIVDHYLRLKEGVRSFEVRNLDAFKSALAARKGILLAPNHCRYADPLVMGWPARLAKTHVYAMASWHLFNKSWLDGFAIQKMGGFSIHREASDRQSLETAIEILATGERPLILFPEGTTSRMNDDLKDLLEGIAFIARSAAKKSLKRAGNPVVMLPVAIKYLCKVDCLPWIRERASQLERHFDLDSSDSVNAVHRVQRLADHWLASNEIQILGSKQDGSNLDRRKLLAKSLLDRVCDRMRVQVDQDEMPARIRAMRAEIIAKRFGDSSADLAELSSSAKDINLCQELMTFTDHYLEGETVTDTRLVETLQRLQEVSLGRAIQDFPLHAVIEFGNEIDVPSEKAPRGQRDPLLDKLQCQLSSLISGLSSEAGVIASL